MNSLSKDLTRTLRYWYIDGLSEIAGGLVVLLLGLTDLLAALVTRLPYWNWILGIGQPLLIFGAALLTRNLLPKIKEKVTYPRTGYVEYRKRTPSQKLRRILLPFLVAFLISALLGVFNQLIPDRYWPLLLAACMGLAITYLGIWLDLRRFYLEGFFCLVLGAALSWANLSDQWAAAYIFSGLGLMWVISGFIVFIRYLRSTAACEQGAEDE
jgi:MFS family permease